MSETSNSSQSSQGTSSSSPTETAENAIMDQISGVASGMAASLYNWAQGVFAKTSAITDQAVGNFFQVSQQMMGLSNNMINQYNNLFAPENAQLVADANSYASPARLAADMGAAGATAAQAGSAAEANSMAQLQQYGIDPSSGRYAGLINADNVANAGNVAGQENLQERADVATGQQLRAEAVQTGAQLPSSIANVENTGIQANSGAENAELANANTGANLFALPNQYLGTAMGIKLPPTSQRSQSTSGGQSSGQKNQPTPQQKDQSGQNGGQGGGAGAPAWGMNNPNYGAAAGGGFVNGGGNDWGTGVNNDALGGVNPSDFTGGNIYNPDPNQGTDLGFGDGSQAGFLNQGAPGTETPTLFTTGDNGGGVGNPYGNNDFGQTFDQGGSNGTFGNMGGGTDTQFGNISYDPSANQASLPSGWNDSTVTTDYTPPSDQAPAYDPGSDPNPAAGSGGDYSGGDSGGGGSGDYGYAGGGSVQPRGVGVGGAGSFGGAGKPVPASMSPSRGQRVDDVRAKGPGQTPMRLNANEFVIPQDVALWKGQEFFQNMINQSRKARISPASAPAKPTRGAT